MLLTISTLLSISNTYDIDQEKECSGKLIQQLGSKLIVNHSDFNKKDDTNYPEYIDATISKIKKSDK